MILSQSIYVKVQFYLSSLSMVLSNMRQCERIQDLTNVYVTTLKDYDLMLN
jgi:hypothetical protein